MTKSEILKEVKEIKGLLSSRFHCEADDDSEYLIECESVIRRTEVILDKILENSK